MTIQDLNLEMANEPMQVKENFVEIGNRALLAANARRRWILGIDANGRFIWVDRILQENNGHGGHGNGVEGGHGGGGEEGGHGGGAVDGAEGNQEDEDDDNENGDDAISAIVAAAIRHAKLMMKNAWRAVVLTAGFRLAITLASFIRIIYLSFSTANNPMPRSLLRQRIARDWVAINVVDDDVWMDAFLDLFFALSLALAHFEEDQLWLDTEA